MKKGKVKYIITDEFKTDKPNLTKEEMKEIFNRKYFKYIMSKETSLFNFDNNEKDIFKEEKEFSH